MALQDATNKAENFGNPSPNFIPELVCSLGESTFSHDQKGNEYHLNFGGRELRKLLGFRRPQDFGSAGLASKFGQKALSRNL